MSPFIIIGMTTDHLLSVSWVADGLEQPFHRTMMGTWAETRMAMVVITSNSDVQHVDV